MLVAIAGVFELPAPLEELEYEPVGLSAHVGANLSAGRCGAIRLGAVRWNDDEELFYTVSLEKRDWIWCCRGE